MKLRPAAPQRRGGIVEIGHSPVGVGHVDGRRQEIKELPWSLGVVRVVQIQQLATQARPDFNLVVGHARLDTSHD
jgi:hypothetical protein